jgi:hypothetical protein
MNWKLIALSAVLVDFSAFSAYAVWRHGYLGLFALAFTSAGTVQVFLDLIIALSLVMIWMVRDGRQHRIGVAPYLATTLLLGSIGPLLYLIRRERLLGRAPVPFAAPGQRVPA